MALARRFTRWSMRQLEICTLPAKGPKRKKIPLYCWQAAKFCFFFPLTFVLYLFVFFRNKKFDPDDSPLIKFAKNPHWKHDKPSIPMRKDEEGNLTPIKIGFSTADIQDSGPHSPQFMGTNWGNFYEKNKEEIGSLEHLPDMLNKPDILLEHLAEFNIKNWRTSINLMPRDGEKVNRKHVAKYCKYFKALTDAGIEVMVTLNHFVHPDDFDWRHHDSVRRMKSFAEEIADDLYKAGIRKLLISNEQAVFAVQSHVMGRFPPHGKMKFTDAAKVMHNMMLSQVECYHVLKKKHPEFQIGLTHDPVRFRYYHKSHLLWTTVERILCHYLSEIFHGSLHKFMMTGTFTMQIPFFCNYSFTIHDFADPKKRPMDFVGLQYYTDPLIRLPQGSVSRVAGERLSAYQYRPYPQGIASALEEMAELNLPVEITETGIDVEINKCDGDKERIQHFDRIFQSVQKAIDHGIDVRSLHLWTKDKSWEWSEGTKIDFSLYDQHGMRGAGKWLKSLMNKKAAKKH